MAKIRSQRAGRKNNNDMIRELVSLLGSLSRTGDSVSLDAISSRLGVSLDEARSMMDIVCQASGEEFGGLLISSNDDETEFTLQFPGTSGRPVRLTGAETIALIHALDMAGIDEQDPLRQRLSTAFSSPEIDVEEVRMALGVAHDAMEPLFLCARSQAEGRSITFLYQGSKDDEPRTRKALVQSLRTEENNWYVRALDLDLDQGRTFRADRMTSVALGDVCTAPAQVTSEAQQSVHITFTNKTYYRAFHWPTLEVIHEDDECITGVITYYGEGSTWLLRRICAGNGCITVDDDLIMSRARSYALNALIQAGYYA